MCGALPSPHLPTRTQGHHASRDTDLIISYALDLKQSCFSIQGVVLCKRIKSPSTYPFFIFKVQVDLLPLIELGIAA